MEDPTDTLGQRLKLARKKRGMTQEELAYAAAVKQSDVSKLERGKALATSSIARLARSLRVPAAWLEENQGKIPDWDAPEVVAAPPQLTMTEEQLVAQLRPEWRDLILAYEDLLPSDRELMVRPMLEKAADMRRYFEAAMARQGVSLKPLRTTGNNLPMAPTYEGPERRTRSEPPREERRNSLLPNWSRRDEKQGGKR